MMDTFTIKNAKVWIDNKLVDKDIYVERGTIKLIEKNIQIGQGKVYNFKNHIVVPGLIDVHVYLKEPGFNYIEDIVSGSKAAAHGGYSTICCMPNLGTQAPTAGDLKFIIDRAKQVGIVNILPYSSITVNRDGVCELVNFDENAKYAFAFCDDGGITKSDKIMRQAMLEAKRVKKVICTRAEDLKYMQPNGSIHQCNFAKKNNIPYITSKSEWLQVGRYLNLAVKTRAQYHLCSVSCKESVNLIKVAKKLSKNISCEVTPHHLLLNCSMIDRDCGIYKVNPPLRNPEDQRALIRGIKNGTIDMIATDHAPHSEEEKLCKFVNSTFGIASLDFAFPLLYTKLVEKNVINLSKLIHLMSINPAKRFKLPSNEIAVKKIANFMIFDPHTLTEISKEMICSKSFISPYLGTKCRGWVKFNVVNGKIVYQGKK